MLRLDNSERPPDGQKVEKKQQKSRKHMLDSVFWFPVHPVCECGFDRVAHIATQH